MDIKPREEYTALVADLQGSRKLRDRVRFAQDLDGILEGLGTKFASDWVAPLVTTRGLDELSGVLRRPGPAFDVIVALNLAVWPQRFRFGIGRGTLDVAVGSHDASAIDGAAFHHAAAALQRTRKEKLVVAIEFGPTQQGSCRLAESAALLHSTIMARWKLATARAVQAYRALGTQAQAAARLGVTQQAISGSLIAARHNQLRAAEEAIRRWLEGIEEWPRTDE